jgi:hypothetical protein
MFCAALVGMAAVVRCAVGEEEKEGSSPVEEGDQLEKTSRRMLGVVLWGWRLRSSSGARRLMQRRCCYCCLHGHSTDDLATKLGIIGERSGEVSQRPGRLLTERRKGEVLSVQSGARLSVLQRCAEERLGGEKIEEGRRESNGGGGGLGELRVGFKMVGRSGVERWVAGGGGDAHVARGSDREGASRWAHSAWASCWRP